MSTIARRNFLKLFSGLTIFFSTLRATNSIGFGKKIAIVIGHNKRYKGAHGNLNIFEYDFNKELLEEVISELDNNNQYKIFFRPAVKSYTAQQEKVKDDIARWGNVDYAIEFHFNQSKNKRVDGHEVLFLSRAGKELAIKLNNAFNRNLDNKDRGIKLVRKGGRGYGFLKRGHYASAISEPFFGEVQYKYVKGGLERYKLKRAYKDFLNSL